VVERLFRRAADLLRLDESLLLPDRNAELLQVVHYSPEQKYDGESSNHKLGIRAKQFIHREVPPVFFLTPSLPPSLPPRRGPTSWVGLPRPSTLTAHHDWGVEGGGPSRYITLLLYLNDPPAGGQTAFPKAMGKDGKPLALHPGKVTIKSTL
jgi:hypothetical protein